MLPSLRLVLMSAMGGNLPSRHCEFPLSYLEFASLPRLIAVTSPWLRGSTAAPVAKVTRRTPLTVALVTLGDATSLRARKKKRQQLRPALPVDDPVDEIGTEAPLKGDHRFLRIGHVIAEALER